MNGPEHYKRAEQLLEQSTDPHSLPARRESLRERAQVHATLALAAATIYAIPGLGSGGDWEVSQ